MWWLNCLWFTHVAVATWLYMLETIHCTVNRWLEKRKELCLSVSLDYYDNCYYYHYYYCCYYLAVHWKVYITKPGIERTCFAGSFKGCLRNKHFVTTYNQPHICCWQSLVGKNVSSTRSVEISVCTKLLFLRLFRPLDIMMTWWN